jgi:hypothetical protein
MATLNAQNRRWLAATRLFKTMGAKRQIKKLKLTAQAMACTGVSRPKMAVTPKPTQQAKAKA